MGLFQANFAIEKIENFIPAINICITIFWGVLGRSFVDLTRELLQEGYKYVLSEHLTCQDAVEQYFAKQRDATGGNNAPNTKEFLTNNILFQVTKQTAIAPSTGNTNTETGPIEIDDTPLPKKKKK